MVTLTSCLLANRDLNNFYCFFFLPPNCRFWLILIISERSPIPFSEHSPIPFNIIVIDFVRILDGNEELRGTFYFLSCYVGERIHQLVT